MGAVLQDGCFIGNGLPMEPGVVVSCVLFAFVQLLLSCYCSDIQKFMFARQRRVSQVRRRRSCEVCIFLPVLDKR